MALKRRIQGQNRFLILSPCGVSCHKLDVGNVLFSAIIQIMAYTDQFHDTAKEKGHA